MTDKSQSKKNSGEANAVTSRVNSLGHGKNADTSENKQAQKNKFFTQLFLMCPHPKHRECTLKTAYKFEKEFRGCRLTTKARNKFLAYVDFANANIFPDKPFRKQVFQRLTENLNADKI